MTPVDAEAVASAALACPDVAALSGGSMEEVATYLPGRRVSGVRVRGDALEVHVVARWGKPLPQIAEQVRASVVALAGGRPVTVAIEDVEVPTEKTEPGVADPAG